MAKIKKKEIKGDMKGKSNPALYREVCIEIPVCQLGPTADSTQGWQHTAGE